MTEFPDARGLPVSPQPAWLTPKQVMDFNRISRKEVYRRMQPGDPCHLVWRDRREVDGKAGRLIDPRSMTFDAQRRWREDLLRSIVEAKTNEANRAVSECPQLHLLPQTEVDKKIAALDVPAPQRAVIMGRFRVIEPLTNHNYKAMGYASRACYVRGVAEQARVSRRTVERWFANYMEREDLEALGNELPGPEATGVGSLALDLEIDIDSQAVSARAFIKQRWLAGDLKTQIYSKIKGYLTEKQRGCGVSYAYRLPSKTTVNRFIDSLDALVHARRLGPDALKAACGYMDRSYKDLASLGTVEVDETKINALGYLEGRQYKVLRFWIVTLYDQRAIYPLVWDLIGAPETAKKLHGITQRDELRLFERLVHDYGLPGCLHSDRGRFRGNFWGYERRPAQARDKEFVCADGVLEQLAIRRNKPREKNPRGTRLERFHRFLADCARDLPGWIGADEDERAMTSGDAQAAEHMEYVAGRRATTPLFSRVELLAKVSEWMEAWRAHPSDGTDMDGLAPRAVFLQNVPAAGFRQPTPQELSVIDSEVFPKVKILPGGIVQLPDGKRYGLPGEIALEQHQRRVAVRQRSNPSEIRLLPAQKGKAKIVAHLRPRVGTQDPAALAQATEFQSKLRKLEGQMAALRRDEPAAAAVPADRTVTSGEIARRMIELGEPQP